MTAMTRQTRRQARETPLSSVEKENILIEWKEFLERNERKLNEQAIEK